MMKNTRLLRTLTVIFHAAMGIALASALARRLILALGPTNQNNDPNPEETKNDDS